MLLMGTPSPVMCPAMSVLALCTPRHTRRVFLCRQCPGGSGPSLAAWHHHAPWPLAAWRQKSQKKHTKKMGELKVRRLNGLLDSKWYRPHMMWSPTGGAWASMRGGGVPRDMTCFQCVYTGPGWDGRARRCEGLCDPGVSVLVRVHDLMMFVSCSEEHA